MAVAIEQKKTRLLVEQPVSKPARQRWRWLLGAALLCVLLLWFIPAIVANSPLLNRILGWAAADLKGQITAQTASLGWFSPPSLIGVEIYDEQGVPLAEIPKITGDRSLLSMLWDSSDLGQIRVEKPKVSLVFNEGGSNLEAILAEYLAAREKPAAAINVEVEVVDGTVSITKVRSVETWQIETFQLAFHVSAEESRPLEFEASGVIADQHPPGRFRVGLKLNQGTPDDRKPEISDELTIETKNVPLAMFEPLIGRFVSGTRVSGRLSSAIACRRHGEAAGYKTVVGASATAEQFTLTAPPLKTDRVELDRLQATCQITWEDDRIHVDRLTAESDLGEASLAGTLDLESKSIRDVLVSLLSQECYLEAELDLARLAAILPATLRIQKETKITSGRMKLALENHEGPEGTDWKGQIETTNLTATSHGRSLVWRQPILVNLVARQSPQGTVIQSLQCESDFFDLQAVGTPKKLTASGSFDLSRLTDQLGSFVDLDGLRLAGDGWAEFHCKRAPEQKFEADGELQVKNFELATGDRPAWTEEDLKLALTLTGRTDFTLDTRLDTGVLEVGAGSDWLAARLTQPVLDLQRGGVWPVAIETKGELGRWQKRLGPWILPEGWELGGSYELFAEATCSADSIHVSRGRVSVAELEVLGPWLNLHETKSELTISSGRWDHGRRRLEFNSAALSGASLSARAENVVLALDENAPLELAGTINYQGALDRVQQWTTVVITAPPKWRVEGRFSGRATLEPSAGITAAEFDTIFRDLAATYESGQRIHEDNVRLVGRGSYNHQSRSFAVDRMELHAKMLSGNVAGQCTIRDGKPHLKINGQIDYDLERISELLRSYSAAAIHVAGRGPSPISYDGPLALEAARANASINWTRADLYGFRVGPGKLEATLADGTLQVKPLDLEVNEGRVRLAPQLRLDTEPKVLYLAPGVVAERIRIDPKICAEILSYVAPALAGITTAEGRFSVELEGCRIPLSEPTQGELAGQMTFHSARVGPGPLVRELAMALGYTAPAELARESVVWFRMVEGRVYHRDLELVFPDLTIRTYGSVGLDPELSLAVMTEMPVPPKWLGHDRMLDSALRNQTIRLPIGGTLKKPRIDSRALDRLNREFLENTARNVIEDQFRRQVERLFRPQP